MPKWLKSFDNWLFGRGNPTTLAMLRIGFSTLALIALSLLLFDFDAWFTEHGYVPRSAQFGWVGEQWRLSLIWGTTNPLAVKAVYAMTMLAAIGSILGLFTRVSTALLALGVLSLHHHNTMILNSGDTLLRLCLIYIAFSPSGCALSLDRRIAIAKGKATSEHPMVRVTGQRLVGFQLALMYLTTVWWKWFGFYWRDMTATYYPTQLREFDRFWVPSFVTSPVLNYVLTAATLIVELGLATFVFYKPTRKYALILGLLLHGWIEWSMNIPLFSYIVATCYMSYYDGDEMLGWLKRQQAKWLKRRGPSPESIPEPVK